MILFMLYYPNILKLTYYILLFIDGNLLFEFMK